MSFPYQRILCPVDFDETSAVALKEAGALAALCHGRVIILHAVRINPLATEGFVLAELENSQLQLARTKVAELVSHVLGGTGYDINIRIGEPAETILAMEGELHADLIVMATHGRRGVRRLVIGSVADQVIRRSSVPVLAIRTHAS